MKRVELNLLESKRKAIIFLVIAFILAAIAGILLLQKVEELNSDLGRQVEVYVANTNISSREIITPEAITTDEIPRRFVRDEHVTDIEELYNKVSVVPLSKGELITKNMLKDATAVTDSNHRLIALLKSDNVFFDEELHTLDRVDIIVSHTFNGKPETNVFMTDVNVAKVARNSEEFVGIQVEIPFAKVTELIHMQNYADSIRVVKANVGQFAGDGQLIEQGEGNEQNPSENEEAQSQENEGSNNKVKQNDKETKEKNKEENKEKNNDSSE